MEIICIDKKTFDEFRTRFCELEGRMARLCRSQEDTGLKNWMDNQDVCDVLHISKKTLQVYRDKGLLPFTRIKHKMFYKPDHFIEKKDPHVEVLFQGLENLERMLSDMEKAPKPLFLGERFLTDEELSGILRTSRRTLQEYRTFGVIPYYLLQGKVLYKESDIQKLLEDAYKRCREEQRWV